MLNAFLEKAYMRSCPVCDQKISSIYLVLHKRKGSCICPKCKSDLSYLTVRFFILTLLVMLFSLVLLFQASDYLFVYSIRVGGTIVYATNPMAYVFIFCGIVCAAVFISPLFLKLKAKRRR